MSAAAGEGPSSPRHWVTILTGVAVASSALTVVGVLGVQRLGRRRRRHELEDDVRSAARRAQRREERQSGSEHTHASDEKKNASLHEGEQASESTPRYLATLGAMQEQAPRPSTSSGHTTPARTGSPRPGAHAHSLSIASRHSFARHLKGSDHGARPALPASFSSSRRLGSMASLPIEYDESLIREQLSRNYSFLGEEAMSKLRGAFVIIVGAGGVGSWCAIMLLRSGVGRLRIIDFDQVSLSSLNRHACATLPDVGRPKVTVCKEKFAEIAPWADVDARVEIFRGSDAARLLGPAPADAARKLGEDAPAYVVDCIDNIDTKVDLLDYCYRHKIRCFSSMGAGAKADPSLIQVGDLNETAEDPLARSVRRTLRARGVWGGGVLDKKKSKARTSKREVKAQANGKRGKPQVDVSPKEVAATGRDSARQSALDQLEGKVPGKAKRLEDSGRVPVLSPAAEAPRAEDSDAGRSRWSRPLSRRISSASSGESVFYSPMASPAIDGRADLSSGDDSGYNSPQPFRLQGDARSEEIGEESKAESVALVDEGDDDKTIRRDRPLVPTSEEEATSSDNKQRPPLATLQLPDDGDKQGNARRGSSLQELAAVDLKSAESGKIARPPSPSLSALESAPEEDNETLTDQANDSHIDKSKPPYTIMCVYTSEKSDTRLLPLDEEEFKKGNVDELSALEDFRVRILPVLGPLPAMFGLAAATYVLCDIAGKELEPLPGKNRRKMAERMWTELEGTERRYPSPGSGFTDKDRAIGPRRIPWSIEDAQYVFEEVYRCRSVVPPHETLTYGRLLRWDSTLPISFSNVALFTKGEANKHELEVLKHGRSPVEVWGEDATRMFKRRMADERRMGQLR